MKKLVFMACAVFALSFMSCGNQTTKSAASSDSDSVTVDTLDSVAADSVASVDSLHSVAASDSTASIAK